MAKREEIEKLKESWLHDPCWDIEDSEGFEEHREELVAFHKEQDVKWEKKEKDRKTRRLSKVQAWTGIYDHNLADVLCTPDEIEKELSSIDNNIGEAGTHFELAQLVIAREHVRATLLLAAQVQRVAELLARKIDDDAGDANLRFMTDLYKAD